jgi:hypothetical protein
MRFIKFILIGAIVLFGVLTALSFLFPSHVQISRTTQVRASRQKVYEALADLGTWDKWNAFARSSALSGRHVSNPSNGKGAVLSYDQLRISEVRADSALLLFDWDFTHGKKFAGGYNLIDLGPDSLTIQTWFDFHLRWYPWEKLGIFVYDRKLGPLLEESLADLKRYLENSP